MFGQAQFKCARTRSRSRLPKGPFALRRHYCWLLMRYLALRDFLQVGLSD